MGFTCKNFIYDPTFVQRKKINLVTPEEMTPAQAYELFLTGLSMMGFTVVDVNREKYPTFFYIAFIAFSLIFGNSHSD